MLFILNKRQMDPSALNQVTVYMIGGWPGVGRGWLRIPACKDTKSVSTGSLLCPKSGFLGTKGQWKVLSEGKWLLHIWYPKQRPKNKIPSKVLARFSTELCKQSQFPSLSLPHLTCLYLSSDDFPKSYRNSFWVEAGLFAFLIVVFIF